jgi:hypothetical protein
VGAIIDALRTRWNASVVGYDLRAQVGLLRKLSNWFESRRSRDDDRGARGRSYGLRDSLKPALRWGAALLIAFVVGWLALRTLRSAASGAVRPRSKQQAQASHLYAELERALARRGSPRPSAATPLEHARKLGQQGFAQHADVELVTRTYLEARYGGRPLHAAELATLKQAIARVRKAA